MEFLADYKKKLSQNNCCPFFAHAPAEFLAQKFIEFFDSKIYIFPRNMMLSTSSVGSNINKSMCGLLNNALMEREYNGLLLLHLCLHSELIRRYHDIRRVSFSASCFNVLVYSNTSIREDPLTLQ